MKAHRVIIAYLILHIGGFKNYIDSAILIIRYHSILMNGYELIYRASASQTLLTGGS